MALKGPCRVDPALPGPEIAVERRRETPRLRTSSTNGGADVGQLVGRDADVVELLGDGERNAVAVVQGASPGREHRPLGPLPPRLLAPSARA